MKKLKLNTGFSLIELMVVIAIIAVIAAIAAPAYKQYVMRSKFTNVLTTIDSIRQAYTMLYYKHGTFYPDPTYANSQQLGEIGYPNSFTTIHSPSEYFAPPLIATAVKAPASNYGPATNGINGCRGIEMEFSLGNYDNGDAFSVISGPGVNPAASKMYVQLYLQGNNDSVESVCIYSDVAGSVAANVANLLPGCVYDNGISSAPNDAITAMFTKMGC